METEKNRNVPIFRDISGFGLRKKFVPRSLRSLHAYNCSFDSKSIFHFSFIAHGRKKKEKRNVLSETETFHSRFRDSWVVDKFVYPQRFSSKRLVDDVATSSLSLMGKPFGQRIDLIVAISAAARSSSRRRAISTWITPHPPRIYVANPLYRNRFKAGWKRWRWAGRVRTATTHRVLIRHVWHGFNASFLLPSDEIAIALLILALVYTRVYTHEPPYYWICIQLINL